jgi:hypothetical protein
MGILYTFKAGLAIVGRIGSRSRERKVVVETFDFEAAISVSRTNQGCQIFLGKSYQITITYTKYHKIYPTAVK